MRSVFLVLSVYCAVSLASSISSSCDEDGVDASSMLQARSLVRKREHQEPDICAVGSDVECPPGVGRIHARCAGNQCCPDGSTCPSASVIHHDGCSAPKVLDCTVPVPMALESTPEEDEFTLEPTLESTPEEDEFTLEPTLESTPEEDEAEELFEAEHVECPDDPTVRCSGNQCCPNGSTCPSASVSHHEDCSAPKMVDSTGQTGVLSREDLQQECSQNTATGGTCAFFGCFSWRGETECLRGRCVCAPGLCSVTIGRRNGVCVAADDWNVGERYNGR